MSTRRAAAAAAAARTREASTREADAPEDDTFGPQPDADSSGLDDGSSDDEYVEEDENDQQQAAKRKQTPREDPRSDAIFQRIAAHVSNAAPDQEQGVGGRSFQQDLAQIDEEELHTSTKKPVRRRLHRAHKPSHEVQLLLGRANLAYITQDHNEAVNLFLEVIRHDPQVQAAWSTLASVYEEMGNVEMARQMKFCGAHIEEDIGTWRELADQFRLEGNLTQALYCYRKALKIDGSRLDIVWQLVNIYRETQSYNKAVEAIRKIHRAEPSYLRDFNMLMEVHALIVETKKAAFGAQVFGDAFMFHFATFNGPDDNKPGMEPNTMKLEHIVVYVDYLLKSGDLEGAVSAIHRGQRWLQGRKHEKGWDAAEDDSEYYAPPRDDEEEYAEENSGGYELDYQLRYRLAIARLRLGHDEEAMSSIGFILDLDADIHTQLFMELGDALMKRQMWEPALEFWAALHDRNSDEDDPSLIYKLGICQHQLKRNAEALESLQWVITVQKNNLEARLELASVLEDMGRKSEALDLVSDVIGRSGRKTKGSGPEQRLTKRVLENQATATMSSLWGEVQEAEQGINEGEPWALDKFIHSAGTMIETFRLAKSNFTKNRGITRVLKNRKYGSKGDADSRLMAMHDRLERVLGFEDETPLDQTGRADYEVIRQTSFYGIGTEDWLALTIKYCCVLMVKNEEDVAMDILEHVVWSGLFNNRRCEIALRLATVACAMRMRSFDRIVDNCKRLQQMHQFRSEPLLLMLAALGGGFKQQGAWHNLALQKFLHREVRIYDEAVCGVPLRFNKRHMRWAQIINTGVSRRLGGLAEEEADDEASAGVSAPDPALEGEGDEDEEGADGEDDAPGPQSEGDSIVPRPKKHSPVFNALYGQNMLTTRSYQSALFYFMRAYESNPYDPFLCFLIAQAYFGRALNRQSDNRNYQIAQGLAFLSRYRKLSAQDAVTQEEVEYNYGRSFYQLGITHLAVKHFEAVLGSVRYRMSEAEDGVEHDAIRQASVAWEAAHNLVLIYTASGSIDLVRARSEEWLGLD